MIALALAASVVASAPAAGRCLVEKTFDLYAIPSGYEGGTKDVFVKGVPRTAKNLRVRFISGDGAPVAATAFPLQTWTATLKGFRAGGLWVQIRLAGYGYGMPVATVAHWRAIVTYDC